MSPPSTSESPHGPGPASGLRRPWVGWLAAGIFLLGGGALNVWLGQERRQLDNEISETREEIRQASSALRAHSDEFHSIVAQRETYLEWLDLCVEATELGSRIADLRVQEAEALQRSDIAAAAEFNRQANEFAQRASRSLRECVD